jgi:hypothetical protein
MFGGFHVSGLINQGTSVVAERHIWRHIRLHTGTTPVVSVAKTIPILFALSASLHVCHQQCDTDVSRLTPRGSHVSWRRGRPLV